SGSSCGGGGEPVAGAWLQRKAERHTTERVVCRSLFPEYLVGLCLKAVRLHANPHGARHTALLEQRRGSRGEGEADLVVRVREVFNRHEPANTVHELTLHVHVYDGVRVEPHALKRRGVALVTPNGRPIAEQRGRIRRADRLLRRGDTIDVRLRAVGRSGRESRLLTIVVV